MALEALQDLGEGSGAPMRDGEGHEGLGGGGSCDSERGILPCYRWPTPPKDQEASRIVPAVLDAAGQDVKSRGCSSHLARDGGAGPRGIRGGHLGAATGGADVDELGVREAGRCEALGLAKCLRMRVDVADVREAVWVVGCGVPPAQEKMLHVQIDLAADADVGKLAGAVTQAVECEGHDAVGRVLKGNHAVCCVA